MSICEARLFQFLDSEGIVWQSQVPLSLCPFNKSGKYKVDFYLPEFDLYVEVKGVLSYYSINEVRYVDKILRKNIYLLSMTNEDWMGRFECSGKKMKKEKIEDDIKEQFEEFRKLKMGSLTAEDLVKLSRKRIRDYIKVRDKDLEFWARKREKT